MQLKNIININVDRLVTLLTTTYKIKPTSSFTTCNLDISAMAMPCYTGKGWSLTAESAGKGEYIANLAMPKALMRAGVPFDTYALNLTFGVLKALFDAKTKDYEKDNVKQALAALGMQVCKRENNQRYVTGTLPADVLAAIDTPPIWQPKKTKGSRQVKFSCCGNTVYIPDGKELTANEVAAHLICSTCGQAYYGNAKYDLVHMVDIERPYSVKQGPTMQAELHA